MEMLYMPVIGRAFLQTAVNSFLQQIHKEIAEISAERGFV